MAAITIPFFGREDELERLRSRCAEPGLTIVKGPPQIGKTTLLLRLVNDLRADSTSQSGHRSHRVGWAESGQASGDVLLRAIRDAYDHWIKEVGALGKMKSIHDQMRGRYISEAGVAFGKAIGGVLGPAKDPVAAIFSGLAAAHNMVQTGGTTLAPLQSEEAQELLKIIADRQTRPVVIVLNQWEEGQDLRQDIATFRDFLGGLSDWPSIHIFLHLRDPKALDEPNPRAVGMTDVLLEPQAAETFPVDEINFAPGTDAYLSLRSWLVEHFPAFADMGTDPGLTARVLQEIDGNPRVLYA